MLLRWTLKSLLEGRGGLAATAGAIGAALLLVFLVEGLFAGESRRIVAYPRHAGADVWVMQEGVRNLHMATSLIPGGVEAEVEAIPGVAGATPLLYVNAFLRAGGASWFSYVVGLPVEAERGGPWAMEQGRERPRAGEAVVPAVLAGRAGIGIGDEVEVLGRTLRVAGLSRGTYSMANSVTFVAFRDLAELLRAPRAASYLLVEAAPGTAAEDLARRIRRALPEIEALPRDAFVENDRRMALQMGVEVIRVMTGVGALLATLIVAFLAYASAAQRSTELAVTKAVGMRNRALYASVLVQTLAVAFLGYAVALALAIALRPAIEILVPEAALVYEPATALRIAAATPLVAVLAAGVPAWRIARIDPARAFAG